MLVTAFIFLFCLGMVYGAICDLTTFTIPNRVSYGLILLFLPYAVVALPWQLALIQFGLALLVFVICVIFWKLRWLGGGDVKFLAAASLWIGPPAMLTFLVLLSLLSLVFVTALRLLRERNDLVQASGWPNVVKQLSDKAMKGAIPYGLPIAMSAITVYFLSWQKALPL